MILDEKVIKNNYKKILDDIKKYSPYPEKVKILFVSKYFSIEEHKEIINMGYDYFGENRAQLYRDKKEVFSDKNEQKYGRLKWDFIGRLQKNKIRYIINNVNLIHSIDSYDLLKEIDRKAKEIGRVVEVLVQINVSKEESKTGIYLEDFNREYEKYFEFENVKIKGFMTMMPLEATDSEIENYFEKMYNLKEEFSKKYGYVEELSMGMSNDYELALKKGATIIRIGRKLIEK